MRDDRDHMSEVLSPNPDAIDEWVALFANRNEMAGEYARWIRNEFTDDWRPINDAIVRRWSLSGLLYIKRKAWAILREEDETGEELWVHLEVYRDESARLAALSDDDDG